MNRIALLILAAFVLLGCGADEPDRTDVPGTNKKTEPATRKITTAKELDRVFLGIEKDQPLVDVQKVMDFEGVNTGENNFGVGYDFRFDVGTISATFKDGKAVYVTVNHRASKMKPDKTNEQMKADLRKINLGMTPPEVEKLLGIKGLRNSRNYLDESDPYSCYYHYQGGSIVVTFVEGKVAMKTFG